MTPVYRIANLNDQQLEAIEGLENDLGVTLIAWEPSGDRLRNNEDARPSANFFEDDGDTALQGLLDTYRSFDPHHLS